jgi:hypothetical protein
MHQHENFRAVKGGVNGVVANSATPLSMAWLPTAPPAAPAKRQNRVKKGGVLREFLKFGV